MSHLGDTLLLSSCTVFYHIVHSSGNGCVVLWRGSCYGCWLQTWQCCICQLYADAHRAFIKPLSLVLVLHVQWSCWESCSLHDSWWPSAAESVAETSYSWWQWYHWALAAGRNSAPFRQLFTHRGTITSLCCTYQSTIRYHSVIVVNWAGNCYFSVSFLPAYCTVSAVQYHALSQTWNRTI